MADFEARTFSDLYLREDPVTMDAWVAAPIIARVAAQPRLKDLNMTAIALYDGLVSVPPTDSLIASGTEAR